MPLRGPRRPGTPCVHAGATEKRSPPGACGSERGEGEVVRRVAELGPAVGADAPRRGDRRRGGGAALRRPVSVELDREQPGSGSAASISIPLRPATRSRTRASARSAALPRAPPRRPSAAGSAGVRRRPAPCPASSGRPRRGSGGDGGRHRGANRERDARRGDRGRLIRVPLICLTRTTLGGRGGARRRQRPRYPAPPVPLSVQIGLAAGGRHGAGLDRRLPLQAPRRGRAARRRLAPAGLELADAVPVPLVHARRR